VPVVFEKKAVSARLIGRALQRAFLSPCCLKEKRERHCHPTAHAPSRASLSSDRPRSLFLTVLKNRTVSWCLPGNLGCLFDFLIRSSQPNRSKQSRALQRVRQPWCLKKSGSVIVIRPPALCSETTPRTVLTRGRPNSLIAKQAINSRTEKFIRLLGGVKGGIT
jgi:hypothetical protein